MPTPRILRRLSITAIGAAVIASGAAGSAEAASITVCQKKKGGSVRVIKSTKKCKKSEVRLTIPTGELVQGPAGAKGDRGRAPCESPVMAARTPSDHRARRSTPSRSAA